MAKTTRQHKENIGTRMEPRKWQTFKTTEKTQRFLKHGKVQNSFPQRDLFCKMMKLLEIIRDKYFM